jgi:hypothetical protein
MVTLDGLVVENAAVDKSGALAEAAAAGSELQRCPKLCLAFVAASQADPYPDAMEVPLYHSPTRERHLVDVKVPIRGDEGTWILAGVAFLLSSE